MDDAPPPPDVCGAPPDVLRNVAYEEFLHEEGLDLLASYRTIGDAGIRRQFLVMVRTIAEAKTG